MASLATRVVNSQLNYKVELSVLMTHFEVHLTFAATNTNLLLKNQHC